MSILVTLVALLPALLGLAVAAFFAAQILLSLRDPKPSSLDEPPPFIVIIPAHDEASVIGATLHSLKHALRPGDHAIVVADNCTDATADIVRQWAIDVYERTDPTRRGKGFALEFGVSRIPADMRGRPVVFLDADCQVQPDALRRLVAALVAKGLPVQGRYLLTADREAPRSTRLNAFAIRIKNHARQLGGRRMGVPALLTGSGMAFQPAHLEGVQLGSPEIVEDLVLGLDLCLIGQPPRYCPEAVILSPLPTNTEAERHQRARWEQGSIAGAVRLAPRLIGAGVRGRSWPIMARGLDLMIPPLALLAILLVGIALFEAAAAAIAGVVAGLWIALAALGLFGAAVVIAWHGHGRDLLSLRDILALPVTAAGKLSNLFALLSGRKIGWLRTSRD